MSLVIFLDCFLGELSIGGKLSMLPPPLLPPPLLPPPLLALDGLARTWAGTGTL